MEIRVIRNDRDHKRALREIEGLWPPSGAPRAGTAEAERLELLAILVDDYERKRWPIGPPDPIAAIRFQMEQRGLTQADLKPFIGSSARVSEVLSRRRQLTLPMIRRLRDALGISADVLVGA